MDTLWKKLVIELRFLPVIRFPELVQDYFQKILEGYTTLHEQQGSIALRNDQFFTEIFHHRNRAGIMMENIADERLAEIEIKKLLELMNVCNVEKFARLGLRTWTLLPIEDISYENAIKRLADHVFVGDNLIIKQPNLSDFSLTLVGDHEESEIRINLGVMNKKEIGEKINAFPYDGDPPVAVLYDIDRFELDLDHRPSMTKLRDMYRANQQMVGQYSEQVYGKFEN